MALACEGCGQPLAGRQMRWCGDQCRKAVARGAVPLRAREPGPLVDEARRILAEAAPKLAARAPDTFETHIRDAVEAAQLVELNPRSGQAQARLLDSMSEAREVLDGMDDSPWTWNCGLDGHVERFSELYGWAECARCGLGKDHW